LQSDLDRDAQAAIGQLARLKEILNQRRVLADEFAKADELRRLWRRLVALLGRHGLLRHLMTHAEEAIVDYANAILDRLACGRLFLELRMQCAKDRNTGGDRALDLLVRTASADRELQEVSFLSGSQRFRIAVSLSLAIGQYSSHTRRPVQGVIIDEGFGCLDSVNRQVMIQELHHLRNYLQCVLIVSHQEEFATAFSDGYQCEVVDGTTRLIPFHR
jgi:DNA repair exonuclease SbcCD ATPase subunit